MVCDKPYFGLETFCMIELEESKMLKTVASDFDETSFKYYKLDTIVNVEIDILARYLERINLNN